MELVYLYLVRKILVLLNSISTKKHTKLPKFVSLVYKLVVKFSLLHFWLQFGKYKFHLKQLLIEFKLTTSKIIERMRLSIMQEKKPTKEYFDE